MRYETDISIPETIEEKAFSFGSEIAFLLSIVRRRWVAGVLIFILFTVGGLILLANQKPIYKAKATIIIKADIPKPLANQVEDVSEPYQYYYYHEFRKAQRNIVISRNLLAEVASRLSLDKDEKFLLDVDDYNKLGKDEKLPDAVDVLTRKIDMTIVNDSVLAYIEATDSDPARAALLANTTLDAYIDFKRNNRAGMNEYATSWLTEQSQYLKTQLEEAEKKLYEFQKSNKIEATSFKAWSDLLTNQQAELSVELNKVQTEIKWTESELEMLKANMDNPEKLLANKLIKGDESINYLRIALLERQKEFTELGSKYGPQHPEYKISEKKLNEAQNALQNELNLIIQRTSNNLQQLKKVYAKLSLEMDNTKADALRLNNLSVEYERLQYELNNARELYSIVLKRGKEIQIASMPSFSEIEVVERAFPPSEPSAPKKASFSILIFVLATLFSFGGMVVFDLIDKTPKRIRDIEEIVKKPLLGIILRVEPENSKPLEFKKSLPRVVDSKNIESGVAFYPYHYPYSLVAEAVRFIRTNIMFLNRNQESFSLMVTSTFGQEGKSVIANYLAQSFATMNKRVVIVDTDMRRPSMHTAYEISLDAGLAEWLSGKAVLEEIVHSTRINNLHLIPSGKAETNPAELLSSVRLPELFSMLAQKYDVVIIDAPPVMPVSDAMILSRFVTNVVYVVKPVAVTRASLANAVQQLSDIGAPLIGFVANDIDAKRAKYYIRDASPYLHYSHYYNRAEESPEEKAPMEGRLEN